MLRPVDALAPSVQDRPLLLLPARAVHRARRRHTRDRVVITVKGLLLTSVLATGTTEADRDIAIDGSIDDKKIEPRSAA